MKPVEKWNRRVLALPPYLVLALGILVTIAASVAFRDFVRSENQTRLADRAGQIRSRLESQLNRYENALIQVRAFMNTTSKVDRSVFRKYVDHLMLLERYPGIQGLGYTVRVPAPELRSHVRQVRAEGFPAYKVWPASPRADYFSIIYLEPFDWRNQRALGFDMFTDPIRHEAMARARDTGMTARSGWVKLIQETSKHVQRGFLLYLPVFKGGVTPNTVEGRREALIGFVYSPFRAQDLFDALFKNEIALLENISVDVFDGSALGPESRLASSDYLFGPGQTDKQFDVEIRSLAEAGREMTVRVAAQPGFATGSSEYAAIGFGIVGTILSVLFFWVIASGRRHLMVESASKETLEQINSVSQIISGELELEKLVQGVTDAGTRLTRAQFGAFFYNVVNSAGESYTLYTISGVPREEFAKFPMPRNTKVFGPTFAGTGIVRSDDITKDPRYGHNPPYNGMPKGHLPVRSYLAVPVVSRSGETLGGLFFGHSEVGRFTAREEQIIIGVAAHAAVAIDNARLYKRSQESIKARDEFLSISSHELKTPITSLKLQVQISQRQVKRGVVLDANQLGELFESLDRQLSQLNKLVDDMLDIARIETGKLSISREKVDFSRLVNSVVKRFIPHARSRGIEIIQKTDVHVSVEVDPDRISQVITNLLSNALKYGNDKPIEVTLALEGAQAKLSVRDHGMGIPEGDQGRIFDRFERVAPYQNISGLGLGLFISRQIAEAHEGLIRVTSRVGEGSVFTLELPVISEQKTVVTFERRLDHENSITS